MSRNTNPSAATVRLVRERDGNACVRCGTTNSLTTQHRVARGMGGSRAEFINRPDNLLTLCGSGTTGCHGYVEANPVWARAHGWAVSRYVDPRTVPVFASPFGGWVLLTEDGTTEPAPAALHG